MTVENAAASAGSSATGPVREPDQPVDASQGKEQPVQPEETAAAVRADGEPQTGGQKTVNAEASLDSAPSRNPEPARLQDDVLDQANRRRAINNRLTAGALMLVALLVFTVAITSLQHRPETVEEAPEEVKRKPLASEPIQLEPEQVHEVGEFEGLAGSQSEEDASEQQAGQEPEAAGQLDSELERRRLEQEQRQAEIEQELLELERDRERNSGQDQDGASQEPSAASNEPESPAAGESPVLEDQDRQSFDTDPCSSPSARFLETCKQ